MDGCWSEKYWKNISPLFELEEFDLNVTDTYSARGGVLSFNDSLYIIVAYMRSTDAEATDEFNWKEIPTPFRVVRQHQSDSLTVFGEDQKRTLLIKERKIENNDTGTEWFTGW